jgi:hypothetical protein
MISATPLALTTATLEGAPAGLTLTARLVDGDETLATVVTVTPKLDADGDALDAYTAVFTAPAAAALPVTLEWLEGATVVGFELVVWSGTLPLAGIDDPYFTVAEARAFSTELANVTKYPDAAIETTRVTVEQELERRCGVAFVPRAETEVIDANGATDILLRWPRPLTVTSATLDDTALTVGDVTLYRDGRAYLENRWTSGRGNLTIAYTHGYETIPGAAKLAALTWTKSLLVKGPLDARTTSYTTDDGQYTLATPGMRGSQTGIPIVDEFINSYNLHVAVA